MMYGFDGMMGGWGTLGTITTLVVLIDLALLGVWLWQKISKK